MEPKERQPLKRKKDELKEPTAEIRRQRRTQRLKTTRFNKVKFVPETRWRKRKVGHCGKKKDTYTNQLRKEGGKEGHKHSDSPIRHEGKTVPETRWDKKRGSH